MNKINNYLLGIGESLSDVEKDIEKATTIIDAIRKVRRRLWVLGNGGSMAIAQHFAQDLLKMNGVITQAINCPSILTAFTNDESFENSFSLPLQIMMRDGDGILIFSCSGSSRNYKSVVRIKRGPIISIVGTDGGFLKTATGVEGSLEKVKGSF